jgi:hypothetical protein
VKNFNLLLQRLIFSIFCIAVVIYLWPVESSVVRTRRFCAYGELYVEFEHHGKIWGTTFLDELGRPVPCNENPEIQEVELRTI